MAFSVPKEIPEERWPPTLVNILKEHSNDLGLPKPTSGDLSLWASRGVLLWNAIPTCTTGKSLSHDWTEWTYLTKEILEVVSAKGVVVVLMGSKAQSYAKYVDTSKSKIIETAHPSPLAYKGGRILRNPFLGSRLFSNINAELKKLGKEPIDWRL